MLYTYLSDGDLSEYQHAISVMDLLYLYNNPTLDNFLINTSLSKKVDSTSGDQHRHVLYKCLD